MLRPPPPPAPRGSRPGCRPAGEGGTWQRAPCRLGGVAITSTPSTCLLPGLGWEVGEDSRSWAPGPLGSSVPAPAAGRRRREDRLLWEQAAESHWRVRGPVCPREHVAAPVKPRDGMSGRRGVGRGLGPPHPPQPRHGGPGPGQEPRAGLHSGAGGGLLQDTRSSCPHAGERGQEHGRGRPWAQTGRPE